jgi:biopolymer transport protein ExbD
MKFFTKKRRTPVPVILPLIDILAILLIFFIVTTTFKKNLPQLVINLPDSRTAVEAPALEQEPVVLRVKGEQEITLDDQPVTLEGLPEALRRTTQEQPGRQIAMQADREAAFGVVVQILDALKEAGIKNIPAFTQPAQTAPTTTP